MRRRRTKIVATLGPASTEPKQIRALLEAGVDVCRLNFAHASPEIHAETVAKVRSQAHELGLCVGILADLPGPKMRTGPIAGGEVRLEPGQTFTLTGRDVEGDREGVGTTVPSLGELVSPRDEIFLADGTIVLRVVEVDGADVVTEVLRGGVLRSRKGMHLPGAERRVEAFTDADRTALEAALRFKVDMVGLSFVRDADDVRRARDALPKRGHRPLLVAKIETGSSVHHLNWIVAEADAVMVARGDLGIQTPLHRVPLLQKEIIAACNRAGRPVITATQMLESMTHAPLPTRAEVADVANAVVDGTDALMLSEETAIGDDPPEAVRVMAQTALTAETWPGDHAVPHTSHLDEDRVSWAVAHAAVQAAADLSVAAILCPTNSGSTPRRVAAFRPPVPIVAMSQRKEILGGLSLLWGVRPLGMERAPDPDDAGEEVGRAVATARSAELVSKGDLVAVVAGSPGPRAGRTDFVRVVRV